MRLALPAIVGLYLLLSLGFNLATPYGRAPDEGAHGEYVKYVAEWVQLPRLNLNTPHVTDPLYEAHQAPLYYVLMAPLWRIAAAVGLSPQTAVRFATSLLGALGVWLMWRLARRVAPERPELALAATAFLAFLPQRLHVYASISNDVLAEVTATATFLWLAVLLTDGITPRRVAALGALLGAAVLSKANGVLLIVPALATLAYIAWQGTEKRGDRATAVLKHVGICAGVALLVCGWWLARNHMLYGAFLPEEAFRRKFAQAPLTVDMVGRFRLGSVAELLQLVVLPVTFASFWGGFGGSLMEPGLFLGSLPVAYFPLAVSPNPAWVYPVLLLATLVGVVGGVHALLRGLPGTSRAARTLGWAMEGHLLLVVAAFVVFNLVFFQAQGRYLFPALAVIALRLCTGWLHLAPASARRGTAIGIAVAMLGLAVYALLFVAIPGFRAS